MRAVVLVHGVCTSRPEAEAWYAGLAPRLNLPGVDGVHLYEYGWVAAPLIRFEVYRHHAVKRFQTWLADLARRYGPDVTLDVIGYSFGSYLVGHAMTDAGGPRADFGSVVLMGSILSSRDDWSEREGHYRRALNIYSREDEVVRFSTIGQSGWKGFIARGLERDVSNTHAVGYEHPDYQRPGVAWDFAAGFLAA